MNDARIVSKPGMGQTITKPFEKLKHRQEQQVRVYGTDSAIFKKSIH